MRVWGWIAALVIGLALASFAGAETVTHEPVLGTERASAPIPAEMHVRNEGGSDGAGLCVISSVLANGQYQGVPGLRVRPYGDDGRPGQAGKGSKLWALAKARPGGYGPDKLVGLIRETLPGEKYASLLNATPDDLDRLSRAGYPIGGVMGWGQGYPGRISHMVSVVHYRKGGNTCIVDNNFPGEYHWVPSTEYDARFRANGSWAFLWTRLPAPVVAVAFGTLGGGVLVLAAAVKLLVAAGILTR